MTMNKVTINLNMFGAFIKYFIVRNLNSAIIITLEYRRTRMSNAHLMKKPSNHKSLEAESVRV